MRSILIVSVAALLAAPLQPTLAGDVRPPKGAAVRGGSTGGGLTLPSTGEVSGPDMRTTMDEKRRQNRGETVSQDKVKALRELAIEEFGQSSSSTDDRRN
ncbi:hypothetical protein [Rhodovibrio salinarum]|uniref:DUF4148 domain-containing protein n=1 Tax=Rhodovibrio salinarum TaxID=1087 RepID=A0A934QHJ6_9PROT|nr:hypothetical protein [Rhodovibrio salinarum]MBK1696812.1 hypothetical protein [Rhodovibrio salinarum]